MPNYLKEPRFLGLKGKGRMIYTYSPMPREYVILECTEARKEGKSPSRYMSDRNKKLQTEKVEKMKYNPALGRHTLHREVKE